MKKRRFLLILLVLLLSVGSLLSSLRADTQLPREFGPGLRRVASTATWDETPIYHKVYQWLPDGRLLVSMKTSYEARLLDPKTGKQDSLLLFNRLRHTAVPPIKNMMLSLENLAPDGKTVLNLMGKFQARDTFYRTLTLEGYQMSLHPLQKHFFWTPFAVWEWNDHYQGWVEFSYYMDFQRSEFKEYTAAGHYDLAHPDTPRIVEIPQALFPTWTAPDVPLQLWAVTSEGKGIFLPGPQEVRSCGIWIQQHKVPVTLIDIDQGKQPSITNLIPIPPGADVQAFAISPDAGHIAWHLRFLKPHAIPGNPKLYKTDEIWVSDLDGAHVQRLGYQAVQLKHYWEGLNNLAWKDNQTVSFIFNQVLYTVPLR